MSDTWTLTIFRVNDAGEDDTDVIQNVEELFNPYVLAWHLAHAACRNDGWPWELHCNNTLVADSSGYTNPGLKPPSTRPSDGYGHTWGSTRG